MNREDGLRKLREHIAQNTDYDDVVIIGENVVDMAFAFIAKKLGDDDQFRLPERRLY